MESVLFEDSPLADYFEGQHFATPCLQLHRADRPLQVQVEMSQILVQYNNKMRRPILQAQARHMLLEEGRPFVPSSAKSYLLH